MCCWWFMSNIRNVCSNSIGCVTKCGPAGIQDTTDRCIRPTCSNLHTEKIWSNILTARWRASAWANKMNKEQSCDDPSVDLIRVKNMLNSTISMSYPDVVIACIEHKVSLKHSEQLRQRWWSTIIIWRIIPWWLTDHHNCKFKLFSLWQSQHAVCHCQESGKTATQLLQCPRN